MSLPSTAATCSRVIGGVIESMASVSGAVAASSHDIPPGSIHRKSGETPNRYWGRTRVTTASDRDAEIRARIQQHWDASESGDVDLEHEIYAADAILDYPQSGERFRGRAKIQA